MNALSWITERLVDEGIEVPSQFELLIRNNNRHKSPFYFLDKKDGLDETRSMSEQFPSHQIVAFARRGDYDGVVCVVLSDPIFERGQVIILHDDAPPGYEIDGEFASLTAWAKAATNDIEEWSRTEKTNE